MKPVNYPSDTSLEKNDEQFADLDLVLCVSLEPPKSFGLDPSKDIVFVCF